MKLNKMTNANNDNLNNLMNKVNSMSNEEKLNLFKKNAGKLLAEKAEYQVPENGTFGKVEVSFNIPGTQNEAHYFIEHDALDSKNSRTFSIGANRIGSDRLVSAQLKKGTKKEIIEYISDKSNKEFFQKVLEDVSNSVDDYYSSY